MTIDRSYYSSLDKCVICNGDKKRQSKYCITCGHILMHVTHTDPYRPLDERIKEAREIVLTNKNRKQNNAERNNTKR